ncbi:MAG: hypothetical protein JWQ76_2663 [Ramlibacter sp.]|nr:hypothetical protein [Ramlibacter sp.]
MQSKVGGEGTQAEEPQPQDPKAPLPGSGLGAAAAMARLKSQREHNARQKPADDPTHGGRRNDPGR